MFADFLCASSEKTVNLHENVDPELLTSMRDGLPGSLAGVPTRKSQVNDAIPAIAPKWLKHDRQVSCKFHLAAERDHSGSAGLAAIFVPREEFIKNYLKSSTTFKIIKTAQL